MRPRALVAANAVPLIGGQGVNLFQVGEGLAPVTNLEVFAAGPGLRAPTKVVPHSLPARWLRRVPVLRRARGWVAWAEDRHFDHWVARHLTSPAAWFHGVTGQCLRSMAIASALGMETVLDVITAHIDLFVAEGVKECARFGAPFAIHPAAYAAMRQEYASADRIRVMSQFALDSFLARGFTRERVAVVSPPLTLERSEITDRPRRFCVGFVGALEPWKGVHYLVEAFRRAAGSDWELLLVGATGSRPMARYFREVLSTDARIRMEPADVRAAGWARIYERFSVLVYPSVCDGFGQSVAEAMACGVPVIVTSTTGAADLVEPGRTGFVVPPRDPESIAQNLDHLARDRDLCTEMGRRGRATVLRYTPERFQQQYARLLSAEVALAVQRGQTQ